MAEDKKFELFDIEDQMPGEELLADAQASAKQMIAGEIPTDVVDQLESISAERGLKSGLGMGQAARNLTARDIGMTSYDIASRGSALAATLADSQMRFEAIKEQRYEFNRKYQLDLSDKSIKESALAIQGHQLISSNEQYAMGLANELIVRNSINEIKGVQENVDTLLGTASKEGYFQPQNKKILDLINKYTA